MNKLVLVSWNLIHLQKLIHTLMSIVPSLRHCDLKHLTVFSHYDAIDQQVHTIHLCNIYLTDNCPSLHTPLRDYNASNALRQRSGTK
jgi:hypothetical protein